MTDIGYTWSTCNFRTIKILSNDPRQRWQVIYIHKLECIIHCYDDVRIEWNKGNQAFDHLLEERRTRVPELKCLNKKKLVFSKRL